MAIAALATAAFALNLNTNVLGALLPFLRIDVGLTVAQGKQLIAAAAFGSAFGALLFGPLARRCGRRTTMVGALAVFVVLSLLHLVPGPHVWLLALRGGAGLAVGIAYAAASALSAEIVPYHRRGAAMGRFNAGMFLAIPVGMPLSVWFASLGCWPGIFALQALVAAVGIGWALRAVPRGAPESAQPAFLRVLRNGGAVGGLVATGLHVGSFFTSVQLATTWLDQTDRLPKDQQMGLWVGLGALSVVGSSLLGKVSDRFGKRNFVMVTSALLVGCFVLLGSHPDNLLLVVVGSFLAITAAARTGPLQALVSGQVSADQLGTLMSLRGFLMQVGVGVFALGAAPLEQQWGFRAVLYLAAGCQAASYLLVRLWVHEGR